MDHVARSAPDSIANTRLDLVFFVAAFVAGIVAYGTLHFLRAPQLVVTGVLALLMLSYAGAVFVIPRLRVRLDQAGDNAYYLGLLFTLTSMSVALYEFSASKVSEDARVDSIIGNFGIALASTVLGIFLRVFLHQMRVDPADVESVSRIELSEASNRVRADLGKISTGFAHAYDEMAQRTADAVAKVVSDSADSFAALTGKLTSMTDDMLNATSTTQQAVISRTTELTSKLAEMAEEARLATDRLREVKAPSPRVARRLDEISVSVEGLTGKLSDVTESLVVAGNSSVKASSALDAAASAISQISGALESRQKDAANQLATAVQKVAVALEETGVILRKERTLLAELEQSSRAAAKEAEGAQNAAVNVLNNFTDATRGLVRFIETRSAEKSA